MMDILTHDTNLWVGFSFLIFAYIVWSKGKDAFTSLLDSRINTIKQEIETAENLRTEAQELLAQYQRKHRNAVQEAAEIVANAEKHAEVIRKDAEAELKVQMKRREKQLEERIERMKSTAIAQIQQHAANLAINATREIIAEKLDKKANENLVDQSIKNLSKNIG